ncbi:unnamed protein product [Cylindrotheca closterium]|uniref:Uncharacterized protein n=1 Tax=Cylindrotheca closterium TaxID=2856 RepID=A0AAD2FIP3_9STRA|nr:unnamed protein product [Cylindrotheca closterium]
MMEKASDDHSGDSAEIDAENMERKETTSGPATGEAANSPLHDSVSDDTFEDLAELGVQPHHTWKKDSRHSGGAAADMPTTLLRRASSGASNGTRRSGASASSGRLSPAKDDMIRAEYDAEIVEAISSDVEDSDYYTSGSEDEYSDSDTDAVGCLSDTEEPTEANAMASIGSEEKSGAATEEGAAAAAAETKKKKKEKKKKKKEKDKKKKRSSKRSSTSTRANRSVDGSTKSATDKKKKRKSRASGASDNKRNTDEQTAEREAQKELILKLQNQLSEALHKVVTTTEEHINDKNSFLKVSTELAELKGQIKALTKTHEDAQTTIGIKEATISEQENRISKLEKAVERQLDLQEELESKVDRSEEEINKLLEEIEELEKQQLEVSARGEGAPVGGAVAATSRALQAELDKCKAQLEKKEKQIEEYKTAVDELEKDLEEGRTINRLQVNEMEETNISLQGKLKAERLEVSRKLEQKDDIISGLQKEIDNYKRTDDVQDLVTAREKLNATRIELDETKAAKEASMKDLAALNREKEDLQEKLNVLTTQTTTLRQDNKELEAKAKKSHLQVLEWTEKTYDWKSRAEAAEKKLQSQNGEQDPSGDAAPQGTFLQAIMDNQAAKQQQQRGSSGVNLRRSVQGWFGKVSDEGPASNEEYDPDAPVEQMRMQKLEERNASLDATVAQLRSEIVKLQSSHKEKLYSLQKEMDAVRGENEALQLKKTTLQQQSN